MKYILVLYFLSGTTILDAPVVKAFETKRECEAFIDNEAKGMKRMDIYMKYYRDNKNKMKGDEYELTLKCQPLPNQYRV